MKKSYDSWDSSEDHIVNGARFEDGYGNWCEVYDTHGDFVWYNHNNPAYTGAHDRDVDSKEAFLVMLRTHGFKPVSKSTKKMKKSIKAEWVINVLENQYGVDRNSITSDVRDLIDDLINDYGEEGENEDSIAEMVYDDCFKSTKKSQVDTMKKSLLDIEDRFDELPADLQEIARSLCWTLQVNGPVIDKRGDDYYFLFSYYDGDPEYYFEELNIQQNSAEQYNYLNLSEIARNPPEWMQKSAQKMKKSYMPNTFQIEIDNREYLFTKQKDYSTYYVCNHATPINGKYDAIMEDIDPQEFQWVAYFSLMDGPDEIERVMSSGSTFDDIVENFERWCNDKSSYMGKSISIHDMMAQIRQNNNSLKKQRININRDV